MSPCICRLLYGKADQIICSMLYAECAACMVILISTLRALLVAWRNDGNRDLSFFSLGAKWQSLGVQRYMHPEPSDPRVHWFSAPDIWHTPDGQHVISIACVVLRFSEAVTVFSNGCGAYFKTQADVIVLAVIASRSAFQIKKSMSLRIHRAAIGIPQ